MASLFGFATEICHQHSGLHPWLWMEKITRLLVSRKRLVLRTVECATTATMKPETGTRFRDNLPLILEAPGPSRIQMLYDLWENHCHLPPEQERNNNSVRPRYQSNSMVQNKALVLSQVAEGVPVAGQHLVIRQSDFNLSSSPPEGGFTGRVLHASFDPYLRHRLVKLEDARDGFEPLPVGSVIPNGIIVRILRSDNQRFHANDVVVGMGSIQEYVSLGPDDANQFVPIQNPHDLDLKFFLGPLGMPGLTAYSALYEIGQPKKGETIFISAASGAVGQIVGQLALHEGLTVIGSVGSDEKLRLLTDIFKFHGGFNYRHGDILSQLKRLAPNGVDSE